MQSGITASEELLAAFNDLISSPNQRGLIAGIEKESLVPVTTIASKGTFEQDLSQLDGLTKDNEPAYIILRRSDSGPAPFVVLTYVPDVAKVRGKMLFASTRTTLLRELGTEHFGESIFTTTKAELTADGFKKHAAHGSRPAPLTEEEQTLQNVKAAEAEESRGTTARASHTSHSMNMQVGKDVETALRNLEASGSGLVQLSINMKNENIELADSSECTVEELASRIPSDAPRYSFFVWNHTHNGQQESPIIFLYTCPNGSKLKDRMVYASTRGYVVHFAEKQIGIKIAKRIEGEASEVTEASLMADFHPKTEEKTAFSRPKRPGRK